MVPASPKVKFVMSIMGTPAGGPIKMNVFMIIEILFLFVFVLFCFVCLLGPYPLHMEVSSLGA